MVDKINIAIVIPARYASTRFPGKPLADIGGKSMLQRVYENAQRASQHLDNVQILIATDDARIAEHCDIHDMAYVMTSEACKTGTDRVMEAVEHLTDTPDFIVNMQGDAPFTPWDFIRDVIDDYADNTNIDVVTPITQLSWDDLETLRKHKKSNPFSGTTVTFDKDRRALWFSKNIIPAVRKEETRKTRSDISPVYRHIGLYAYTCDALKKFVSLSEGTYEALEGLEQLRFLENNMRVRVVPVDYKGRPAMSGVDTPDDLKNAQALFKKMDN